MRRKGRKKEERGKLGEEKGDRHGRGLSGATWAKPLPMNCSMSEKN